MDEWLKFSKLSPMGKTSGKQRDSKPSVRQHPYIVPVRDANAEVHETWNESFKKHKLPALLTKDGKKPSRAALNKHILSTLSDPMNPITHSDIMSRSDHVSSSATGHQRAETRMNRTLYLKDRGKKLDEQLPESKEAILSGVKVYIDGYLEDTTDTEMKRVVRLAGGQVLNTPSGATHILTSQQLSGSKTHKWLTTKSKTRPHVVTPEWISDSVYEERRLSERPYEVVKSTATPTLQQMFDRTKSKST